MHELPVIRDIISIAVRHAETNGAGRIISVQLEVGALCDAEPEWLSRYVALAAKGTPCEGATLEVRRVPFRLVCGACGAAEEGMSFRNAGRRCASCGSDDREMVSGSEYRILSIKVE